MHRSLRRLLLAAGITAAGAVPFIALSGVALAQSNPSPTATSTPAPASLTVEAGGGEPGYAVNLFMPDKVTVRTGTTITWQVTFEEPHTVTFGNPQGDPTTPIGLPASGPVQYDGTQSFSSGLFGVGYPPGPPGTPSGPTTFSVTFTKAGNFNYFCAIHPNMKGEVDVVDSGTVDTQSAVTASAQATLASALASLHTLNGQQPTAATVTTNADGTKTYTLQAGGPDDPQGDLMQFYPPSVNVQTGDTVTWKSITHTPHTVTFNPQDFRGGDPVSTPGNVQSGAAFSGSGLANSGVFGEGFGATSFSLKFTAAGTFQYVCLLHASEGMVGKVVVAQGSAPSPTTTTTSGAPKAPNTGSGVASGSNNSVWMGLGILAALFVLTGAGVAVVNRDR